MKQRKKGQALEGLSFRLSLKACPFCALEEYPEAGVLAF